MNLTRKVSSTTYPIVFMMVDSTDHITGETGLTPTVTISKNGGSYGAAAGAVSEIANGIYALAGNATDRNTLGELWVHADGGAGVDKSDFKVDIVSHDPYGDLAAILEDTGTTIPDVLTAIKGAGWADETLVALMTAIEAGTVDEATIRTAIGLSTANLDTQLSTIDTEVGTIYSEMASVDDVWDEALSGHSTAGSAGKVLSDAALEASLTAMKGAGWSTETLKAIKEYVDDLETRLTAARAGYLDKLNVSGTLAHSNDADTYKADVSAITGAALSSAGIDAILDEVVVGSYTMRQLLTVMGAALAGKVTGGGTTAITFRGINDASNVIVATVDANGNRSAVTVTV